MTRAYDSDLSQLDQPIQLLPIFRERVWGRYNLAPWFPVIPRHCRIGEVWFTFEENSTSLGMSVGELIRKHPEILGTAADPQHPGICPLLAKLLFTSERLSVQVHPGDAYAQEHHQSLGKTEAWYVLDAEPSGELAAGLSSPITVQEFRRAAESGEIEHLLRWRNVARGDVVFLPAGTVHALGAGLTIFEIQENSDITYRLFDYGRPRGLHLDHGIAVATLDQENVEVTTKALAPWRDELVTCDYFRLERLRPKDSMRIGGRLPYYLLLVCIKGYGTIGGRPFEPGQAWIMPAHGTDVQLDGRDAEWLLAYSADEPTQGLFSA
jgi:mannose-6-phosphate isomerase